MMSELRSGRPQIGFSARGVLLVESAAVVALGVWIISPRFSIGGPSFIDDWSAISESPHQVGNLGQWLNPDDSRFRPGWILWNYLQWHTLDAPVGMVGPNLWGLARLALFVAGLVAATVLLVGAPLTDRLDASAVALVVLPPLAILTSPWMANDFYRFGPQEPILVGAMMLGGAVLYMAAREIAQERASPSSGMYARIGSGSLLWAFGVYQKEVSVCAFILLACLVLAGGRKSIVGLGRLPRRRRLLLAGIGVAVLFPLVHVAFEVARVVNSGHLVYGTTVQPSGARETLTAIEMIPSVLGTPFGWLLLAVAVLGVAASLLRRRPDLIQIGLLLTAIAALAWSVQSDMLVSRYYIPTIALLALGSARAVCMLPRRSRYFAVAVLLVGAFVSAVPAHHLVSATTAPGDRAGTALVKTVARLEETGCPIVVTGLALEPSLALPVLVDLRHPVRGHCGGDRAYLVSESAAILVSRGAVAACIRPRILGTQAVVAVSNCVGGSVPSAPGQRRIGFCLHGVFLNLTQDQPRQDPAYRGATPANFIVGEGLTCSQPPSGFSRRGYATAGMGVAPGIYPYYAP